VASTDRRASSWAIEVRGAPALLHRLVPGSGVVHTDATASCAWAIVESATPLEIDRLVTTLAQHDADPIAVRFDDVAATHDPEWT
jgi:hypothetical protein